MSDTPTATDTEPELPKFVHLRTHSTYALLDGMMHPKRLVGWAAGQAMPAVALTDPDNLFGVIEFTLAANEAGVQPLVGVSLSLMDDEFASGAGHPEDARSSSVVLIARDVEGYRNLNSLVTRLYLPLDSGVDPQEYPRMNLGLADLAESSDGLFLLSGGLGGPVGGCLADHSPDRAARWFDQAREAFGDRLFCEVQRHGLPREEDVLEAMVTLADARQIPLVATNDCRFPTEADFRYHDALRAVAHTEKVADDGRLRLNPSYHFRSVAEMASLFSDLPDAVTNTLFVARSCCFTLHDQSQHPRLPRISVGAQTAEELLAEKTRVGLESRLARLDIDPDSEAARPYHDRMTHELKIISASNYAGYFLIVEGFIAWARTQAIPVGPGRGSGVGSLVAWALQITALDPLRWSLLFERFLNPERISMPDFDIDFCTEKRDRVIEYVRQTHGDQSVAQIITFGKLRSRAAIRDLGRVLGIPYSRSDHLCKMLPKEDPQNPQNLPALRAENRAVSQLIDEDEELQQLWDFATTLEGCYRHASTHAAGVVISDRPLYQDIALYYDPKTNLKATQLNMKSIEKAGLVKFDFLGLSTMTIIAEAADWIARLYDTRIDFDALPLDDPGVYTLIREGHTDGIFQLESSGMRRLAVQLKPDGFADITAMVALFRPGPMDQIPRFIRCKHGLEQITYPHPLLEDILKETYGVAVYQEQIMQMTQTLAGFSLGKADVVRRAMGKKDPETLARLQGEFVDAAKQLHQIPEADGEKIFDTIMAFADYGFNKSHSAAYALVACWTGWLKVHYPDCFIVALLNNSHNAPNTIAQYLLEARRKGITIVPPNINLSAARFTLGEKNTVLFGLGAIRGVGLTITENICAVRDSGQPFTDVGDFLCRTRDLGISRKVLEALIRAGAMDTLLPNRRTGFEAIERLLDYARHCREITRDSDNLMLFTPEFPQSPTLDEHSEWSGNERLEHEFIALGHHLSNHPVNLYTRHLQDFGTIGLHELGQAIGQGGKARIAGYVYDTIFTRTRPKTDKNGKVRGKSEPMLVLKMSDPQQLFSVNLVGEELIAQANGYLEHHRLMIVDADCRWSSFQWHIRVISLQPLEDAVPIHSESILLKCEHPEQLKSLQEILTPTRAEQGSVVSVFLPTAARYQTFTLPGRYQITLDHRRKITALPGLKFWVQPESESADKPRS